MNLAQVVDFDIEKRQYRIVCPEKSGWANPLLQMPAVKYEHPPRQITPNGTLRRTLRGGGREILRVLRHAGRMLPERSIAKMLPGVHPTTVRVRLTRMAAREDILRTGDRMHYLYGLPGGSTLGTT